MTVKKPITDSYLHSCIYWHTMTAYVLILISHLFHEKLPRILKICKSVGNKANTFVLTLTSLYVCSTYWNIWGNSIYEWTGYDYQFYGTSLIVCQTVSKLLFFFTTGWVSLYITIIKPITDSYFQSWIYWHTVTVYILISISHLFY